MAKLKSRTDLINYCLRRLGAPVLKIDVAQEQIEDRVDEALQTFVDKHYDATEFDWFGYKLTQEDIDSRYIKIPEEIIDVAQVLPASQMNWQVSDAMWSIYNQNIHQMDMINLYISLANISEYLNNFQCEPTFRFNRHMHQLRPAQDIASTYKEGELYAIKAFKVIDPDVYTDIYDDKWLKKYTTSLIKLQWAENLQKFNGVVLLGGVTTNADALFQQATSEIEQLEDELETVYQNPINIFFG